MENQDRQKVDVSVESSEAISGLGGQECLINGTGLDCKQTNEQGERKMEGQFLLTKELFMSCKPGQYIMGCSKPTEYEEISDDLSAQWDRWSNLVDQMVSISNSKEKCMIDWCYLNSDEIFERRIDELLYRGVIDRNIFMDLPNGYSILFCPLHLAYCELGENRDEQWLEYGDRIDGKKIEIYSDINCFMHELKALADETNYVTNKLQDIMAIYK